MTRSIRNFAATLCCLTLTATLLALSHPQAASATAGGCYGLSCVGLDPVGYCDSDAQTVATVPVGTETGGWAGQLDLRYSRSCDANWGRFTFYKRSDWGFFIGAESPVYARVTAWNIGQPSQPAANPHKATKATDATTWTYMVNGTVKACTGVQLYDSDNSNSTSTTDRDADLDWDNSENWFWGPCV